MSPLGKPVTVGHWHGIELMKTDSNFPGSRWVLFTDNSEVRFGPTACDQIKEGWL